VTVFQTDYGHKKSHRFWLFPKRPRQSERAAPASTYNPLPGWTDPTGDSEGLPAMEVQ